MKTKFFTLFLALTAMVITSSTAHADPIETFNSSLSGPGTYFGTGNSNAGWDVLTGNASTGSTLQLGLEAINRFVGPITPTTNDYTYTPGAGTSQNLGTWDFAFSVNTGTDPLSNYLFGMTIADLTTGKSFTFNPTLLPDNAQVDKFGTVLCKPKGCPTNMNNSGFQNAENLGFGFLPGYNPNSADYYAITLSAIPLDGSVDPSLTIDVTPKFAAPTPEPSSLMLLGTGILGLAGFSRRKFLSANVS